jgi:hypothetical protein
MATDLTLGAVHATETALGLEPYLDALMAASLGEHIVI